MSNCNYERDCTKVPIPINCCEYCLEKILRNANVEEKQSILGYTKTLADAIFYVYNNYSINSFDDLRRVLTPEQSQEALDKFRNINQVQLDYFRNKNSNLG
jgi:hypothetical protein